MVKGGIDEIYAENAHSGLLSQVAVIAQVDVENNVVGRGLRLRLKADANPAVTFVISGEVARRDSVDKRKEARRGPAAGAQLRKEIRPLALEHGLQARLRNVPRAGTIEIIADFLVVSRDRLSDSAGGCTDLKKPACDLLTRSDLSERSKDFGIEIDRKRLLVGIDSFRDRHGLTPQLVKRHERRVGTIYH